MEKKKLSLKEIGYGRLALLFIVGVLFLVVSLPTKKGTSFLETDNSTYETELESRLAATLMHMEGVGEVDVMITVKQGGSFREEIAGVVVIADGAENIQVKTQIYEAVEALFEVPTHKIKVLKRVSSNS